MCNTGIDNLSLSQLSASERDHGLSSRVTVPTLFPFAHHRLIVFIMSVPGQTSNTHSLIPGTQSRLPIALHLYNNGSVARDHLALERTFLGYLRTSLAVASAGVAFVQFFNIPQVDSATTSSSKSARSIGAAAIIIALALLFIGTERFFSVQFKLLDGKFPVARALVAATTLGILGIIIAALVAIV
ncbi:hypothetical protein CYLTODRAFT_92577 [Cylindrobasidium torrendii FP15055 ss-10]|uniref:DUF202 domain-containing protein n=1 Tax=Cylindrobasidium torrendii FP15055 ss-10 TaxID=1314674 RepID=A0A0D7BWQ4_9AGAR|nr:hypothetical protein CYLTODRAFT_92577 [Cylindrobasidium torrendii FP15055 ss-10]